MEKPVRSSHVPARGFERENVRDHQPDVLFPYNRPQTPEPRDSPVLRLHLALRGHWKNYRKAFKHCRRKLSADAVHSLRVETRRLLSLLDLLQPLVDTSLTQHARRRFKKCIPCLFPASRYASPTPGHQKRDAASCRMARILSAGASIRPPMGGIDPATLAFVS
jgi:CHAD domain